MLLLLIYRVLAENSIEEYLGKYIRIRPAEHDDLVMFYDEGSDRFKSNDEVESINAELQFHSDGDGYTFKARSSWVCSKKEGLSKCEEATIFSITENEFGLKIKDGDQCLTAEETYVFVPCDDENKKQDFIFEKVSCSPDDVVHVYDEVISKKGNIKEIRKKIKKRFEQKIKDIDAPESTKKSLWKLWKSRGWGFGGLSFC